ncbi:hypothetical protein SUGI_0288350 [Cryptomeria japonica]|nr:hypothetical protein SUGI_0288350 [Cryptomeria japonica]
MQMDNQDVLVRRENAEPPSMNMEETKDWLGLEHDFLNTESPKCGKVGRGRGKKSLKELRAQDGDEVNQTKETKLKEEDWESLKKRLGVWKATPVYVLGIVGGLTILWDPMKVSTIGKRETWKEIEEFFIGNDEDSIFIRGDFNVIRAASEKTGGVQIESVAQREFNSCIFNCRLIEVNMTNENYTWSNMRIGSNNIVE